LNASQSIGDERPVPRWSISTTSRARRTSFRREANGASVDAACPGPPARISSGSALGESVFAGNTAAKIVILRPSGLLRSSGTAISPHWARVGKFGSRHSLSFRLRTGAVSLPHPANATTAVKTASARPKRQEDGRVRSMANNGNKR
jgi:hypothetical protein